MAYSHNLQRCWPHSHRKVDDVAMSLEEEIDELHRLYVQLKEFLEGNPAG